MILHKRKEEFESNHNSSPTETKSQSVSHERLSTRRTSIDGSVVTPYSRTGQTKPDAFKSNCRVIVMKNAKLGNISDFITQSKAYAGPQLIVKIH